MGIISTIKSVLGLDGSDRERRETNVTVEREPDASSERAVKESEEDSSDAARAAGSATETGASSESSTADADEGDAGDDVPEPEDSEPVAEIKGIGPAYAGRLQQAGVESVADLASADADELGGETDIAPTRIQNWIDRAQARME